jgi:KRAB domain-containing zinc finger protein
MYLCLEELLRPCRVNLGLDENSKLSDGKKYHKRVQTTKTSCGQRVSPDQQETKDMLVGSKGQHRCILCNSAYTQRHSMLEHMRKKHAGLFIICKHNGHCAEIFRTEAEKSEHILQLTNENDKLIKCDFCCLMYCKRDHAKHLKIRHKNDKLIQCSYWHCPTRFRSEVEKQNHEAHVHASTKKDKCIFCNLFFPASTILHHYRMEHKTLLANAFKCKFYCRRYFLTEADREEHIASAHKRPMRVEAMCLYCNKICMDKNLLDSHIYKHHSGVKIRCKFVNCGQYFHTQTEADEHFEQQHQKIEENKKYRCLKCNFRSAYKLNVKTHIYRMHGEKMLPCSKCSRCFSSSYTLKVHIKRAHSPPKVCPYCNKCYVDIRVHLRQDKCKRCQKVLLCVRVAQLHKKLCKL